MKFNYLTFCHFRNKDEVEVGIVIKQGRQVACIKVKAAATVNQGDFEASCILALRNEVIEQS